MSLDRDWMSRARCRDTDTDWFFAADEYAQMRSARWCRQCPVQAECLQYALETDSRFGVWGGLTEQQRKPMHNEHNGPGYMVGPARRWT